VTLHTRVLGRIGLLHFLRRGTRVTGARSRVRARIFQAAVRTFWLEPLVRVEDQHVPDGAQLLSNF